MNSQQSRYDHVDTPQAPSTGALGNFVRQRAAAGLAAATIAWSAAFAGPTTTCARDESAPPTGRHSTYSGKKYEAIWFHHSGATPPGSAQVITETRTALIGDLRRIAIVEGMRATQEGLLESLARFRNLQPGWNTYGAPQLSTNTIDAASKVLVALFELSTPPDRVLPSPAGGVALSYGRGSRKADIEFFPDGEVLLIVREPATGQLPKIFDVNPDEVDVLVGRLHDWLRA